MLNPAIFLDRDGTVIEEANYCHKAEDVRLIPGAREALIRLKQAGFKLIIITNQSGIGRGYFTETEYRNVHTELERLLGPGLLDAEYFCPATPSQPDPRRKPEPGMLLEAAAEHSIDLAASYMIGDKASDMEAGKRAGTKTILVQTGYGDSEPTVQADHVAPSLVEAAAHILHSF